MVRPAPSLRSLALPGVAFLAGAALLLGERRSPLRRRVYSPDSQQKQYDPDYKYVKQWVPEFGTDKYPAPIVDHKFGRERAIDLIRKGRK